MDGLVLGKFWDGCVSAKKGVGYYLWIGKFQEYSFKVYNILGGSGWLQPFFI